MIKWILTDPIIIGEWETQGGTDSDSAKSVDYPFLNPGLNY